MTTPDANVLSGISRNLVNQFKKDGFLLVENFFDADELDAFAIEVDKAVEYRTADDNRSLAEKNLYEQTFVQCKGLWEDHESVKRLTFHPKLCAAAAALLETQSVQLWHDQALYKESGGRETDAHMDYPFWAVDKPHLVSAWIPFADVKHGGGVMGYVQGSHTMGKEDFVDIGQLRGGEPVDLLADAEVAARPLVWVEAPKGSVIFHHAKIIHAAEANNTNSTRRVFTTVYIAPGCRRTADGRSFSMDRDGVEPGEIIVGPSHPLAWPRDEDDFPSPPDMPGPKTGFGYIP